MCDRRKRIGIDINPKLGCRYARMEILVCRVSRLGVEAYGDPGNHEIPNARGVECFQQFDPILLTRSQDASPRGRAPLVRRSRAPFLRGSRSSKTRGRKNCYPRKRCPLRPSCEDLYAQLIIELRSRLRVHPPARGHALSKFAHSLGAAPRRVNPRMVYGRHKTFSSGF